MAEMLHDGLLGLFSFLLNSWIPVVLSVAALGFVGRAVAERFRGGRAQALVCAGELVAALMWGFLYAEHWSTTRIPVFDYGAPAFSLLGIVALPAVIVVAWRRRHKLAMVRPSWSVGWVTLPLLVLSLVPGMYLVWFYAAAFGSDR